MDKQTVNYFMYWLSESISFIYFEHLCSAKQEGISREGQPPACQQIRGQVNKFEQALKEGVPQVNKFAQFQGLGLGAIV